jgi:hypothetical protein
VRLAEPHFDYRHHCGIGLNDTPSIKRDTVCTPQCLFCNMESNAPYGSDLLTCGDCAPAIWQFV